MVRAPLLWMALAFMAGVFSGDSFSYFPLTTLTLLLLIFLIEIFTSFLNLQFPHYLLIFLFFWGGFLCAEWKEFHLPEYGISRWTGQSVILTGTIDEAVAHYPDHTTLILASNKVELDSKQFPATGKIKLNINRPVPFPLNYGDEIRVPLTLRAPHGFQNLTGFDYGKYLMRHGIEATASLTRPEALTLTGKKGGNSVLRKVYQWREEIRKKAANRLTGDPLAIFLAIIIGESGYLTNVIRDRFMASGTTHILSISGSHLALVAFLTYHITKWLLLHLPELILLKLGRFVLPSRLALFLSIPPVLIYGLLAGNQVATNRSMIMIGVFMIGQILNREQSLLNPLGLSALAILLLDPFEVYDISFQLSFGSVLAIALALERMNSVHPGEVEDVNASNLSIRKFMAYPFFSQAVHGTINYLKISIATTLGTAPLVAYHFNQFNWVGILANGIIIPLVGFLVVPVALVSSFASLFFSSSSLYLGTLNQFLMIWFYKTVQFFARFPYAELHLASPSVFQLLLFYLFILIFLYTRLSYRLKTVLMILTFSFPLWWFWGPRIHFPSKELQITFLDVGQGDSAVIEFPNGKTLLVDGGGKYHEFDIGRLVVAPYLWNRGIFHIDYLAATHPQGDHIGGLTYILRKFSIGEVWTNGTEKDSWIAKEFENTIRENHLSSQIVEAGDLFKVGEVELLVLNPHLRNPIRSSSHAKENNDGIVLKIEYHLRSILMAADIESEAEERILQEHPGMKITLLKVPHHGGKGSADPEFVETLAPEIALFSAGLHNPYHHPHPDTLLLYQRFQIRIHRTDLEGALLFITDGDRMDEETPLTLLPQKVISRNNSKMWHEEKENLFKIWKKVTSFRLFSDI